MSTDLSISPAGGVDIQRGSEFNTDQAIMRAQQEVQGSIIIAKKFPRNEDEASQALWRACKRSSFADRAEYKFPRGKKKNEETGRWEDNIVSGPSASIAREAMRLWGNIQAGTEIVRDTDEDRHIRSFAWDMERNSRKVAETTFRKLIQRKVKTGKKDGRGWDETETQWVQPDERDLRELTNKHAAIAERNCILQLIPSDIIEEAIRICRETLRSEASQDPDAARRRLISGFDELNITVGMLEAYLGHPLAQSSPKEIADLRAIWVSIRDGNSTWGELMSTKMEDLAQYITPQQAGEFFSASKASGYTDQDRAAKCKELFDSEDSRKMPTDKFEAAMAWAKTPKVTEKKAEKPKAAAKEGTVIAPLTPEQETKLTQLFEIHNLPPLMQEKMRKDRAEDLPGLITELEAALND